MKLPGWRPAIIFGGTLWAAAWAADPAIPLAGVVGYPHLLPLYAAGLALVAWGALGNAATDRGVRRAWGVVAAAAIVGVIGSLLFLAGDEPVFPSLLALPQRVLALVALVLLAVSAYRLHHPLFVLLAIAVVVRVLAFVLPYGNAFLPPRNLPEALAQVATAVSFAAIASRPLGEPAE